MNLLLTTVLYRGSCFLLPILLCVSACHWRFCDIIITAIKIIMALIFSCLPFRWLEKMLCNFFQVFGCFIYLFTFCCHAGSLLLKAEENGKSPVIKQVSWFQVVVLIACILQFLVVNHVLLMLPVFLFFSFPNV